MARISVLLAMSLLFVSGCGGADGDRSKIPQLPEQAGRVEHEVHKDQPEDNKSRWQEYLDNKEFGFREEETDVFYSLSNFDGDCQIHMVMNRPRHGSIEFRFVRDGKTLLSVPGREYVPFRHADNLVYFAHHSLHTGSGLLGAYDLNTGEKLWLKRLRGVESDAHLAYRNQVNLRLLDGVLHVIGHESLGDYEEILDRETGERLAYRVFRGPAVSEERFRMNVPEELR